MPNSVGRAVSFPPIPCPRTIRTSTVPPWTVFVQPPPVNSKPKLSRNPFNPPFTFHVSHFTHHAPRTTITDHSFTHSPIHPMKIDSQPHLILEQDQHTPRQPNKHLHL